MDPRPYTVLLLRPDTDWDGAQANWVLRMHVDATSVNEAIEVATWTAIRDYYTTAGEPQAEPDEFAPLAVFPGHVTDLYDPEGD